jgi:molybdate transport system substrate-binding protein
VIERMRRFVLVLALMWVWAAPPALGADLKVGAANGIKAPFERIIRNYMESTGAKVSVTYDVSGNLARQASMGAELDLLILSEPNWGKFVESKGVMVKDRVLAYSPMVMWSPVDPPLTVKDLKERKIKLAIPDPETAAYGRSAREYLKREGLWDEMLASRRLAIGGGPQRALAVAMAGGADAAIANLSSAMEVGRGRWVQIPGEGNEFVIYVPKGVKEDAVRLVRYLIGPEARRILEASGFTVR